MERRAVEMRRVTEFEGEGQLSDAILVGPDVRRGDLDGQVIERRRNVLQEVLAVTRLHQNLDQD